MTEPSDTIQTLADVLPCHARANPRKVALQELHRRSGLANTSYATLKAQADAFASRLTTLGAGSGAAVALVMPNSRLWVAAYYGVFGAGAVAVPIDYAMLRGEPDRVVHMLEDAGARALICDAADAGRVRQLAGPARAVLTAQEAEASATSAAPAAPAAPMRPARVKPEDLAQILYTSGTTGPSKGVELTHGNIIFDVRKSCERFGVTREDCVPALLPYHHAYPLTSTVVLPLYAGARMAVGDIRARQSHELLRRCRPTVLVGVPRVFESILETIRSTAARAGQQERLERALRLSALVKELSGVNVGKLLFRRLHVQIFGGFQLRFAASGGARISPSVLREYFLLGIPLLQGWGMSELSPVGAVQQFRGFSFYWTRRYERKAGSIGRPLDGTDVRLVQQPGEWLPFDVRDGGEMVISGPHVMRGYHGDPARTAQQMTDQGLRSGDIARRDADGDLYIIGRIKHVIVLPSGKKVFPEDDLEEALRRCPTMEEFTVRPIADQSGAEKIGIIVRPNTEELTRRNVRTLGDVYHAIKADIDQALTGKPDYLRQYDFCLTKWQDDGYAGLVMTALHDPCPLKNPFHADTSYSLMKGSGEKPPFCE